VAKSYSAPTGALECVAPAGGSTWAAAQQGGAAQFALFFFWFGFSGIKWFSVLFVWFFMSFLEFELFQV
jgi:hypothetical protein